MAVSGSVAGRRSAGACSPGCARRTRRASKPWRRPDSPCSFFVARDNDATLLLPRDGRVLEHGRPDAVLEAVAAAPLDPSDLRRALTGCADAPEVQSARQVGPIGGSYLMGRAKSISVASDRPRPWRIVAPFIAEGARVWRAGSELRPGAPNTGFPGGLPRTVRLSLVDSKRFDLRLTLSQVEVNVPLDEEAFTIRDSAGHRAHHTQELRTPVRWGLEGRGKVETGSRR